MNRIYRLVFNKSRGMVMAVSEFATAQGKGMRGERGARAGTLCGLLDGAIGFAVLSALSAASVLVMCESVFAGDLPQNGKVVGGQATITTPNPNQMVITQGTQSAAINWQSFNVGAGNTVRFIQPSSTSQVLNRVTDLTGTTQILGSLTANGQVFIVNPQGVVFGKGSVVNAGAILASTRDIDPTQFMSQGARSLFLSGGSTGAGVVVNDGGVSVAPGGWIALAGDVVKNTGSLSAPGGAVALLAGGNATLALSNGLLVDVCVSASQAQATIAHSGSIAAQGGKVFIDANTANSLLGSAVNLTGVVDVSSETGAGGTIAVDAGASGVANLSGARLTATGSSDVGGRVTVTGQRVGLFDGTVLNASGATGGGTVLVGGGAHGTDQSVRNAEVTVMDASASIDASATQKGKGGTVVLWSQEGTKFSGAIRAEGGRKGGDGGWVETSSHNILQALGRVDAAAPHGKSGSWLLDPTDVTISNAVNANASDAGGTWSISGLTSVINVAQINSDLNNGTSVTVTTTGSNGTNLGNITINADIQKTAGANANLTLTANGTIIENNNITSTAGLLNVTMTGPNGITFGSGITFALNNGTLSAAGGNAS
ncbi:filamentous hemagglutinin N-terminal domain-containing protein, partial [Burkholderia diffusa]|uniref:two-partner secretion domain-containing protein n=1 Tax=Burkholderia diffusa TaxID=488732 RepID=UPI000AD57EEA